MVLVSGQFNVVNKTAPGRVGNAEVQRNVFGVSRNGKCSLALFPVFANGVNSDIGQGFAVADDAAAELGSCRRFHIIRKGIFGSRSDRDARTMKRDQQIIRSFDLNAETVKAGFLIGDFFEAFTRPPALQRGFIKTVAPPGGESA